MKLGTTGLLAGLLSAVLAAPVTAQDRGITRERFPFVGTRLAIQVDVEAPGSLRLIRGQNGSVTVVGRSLEGVTTAGLAGGDRLTLTGVGTGPVDYLVSVPEEVWVNLRIPGWSAGRGLGRGHSGSWDWEANSAPEPEPVERWLPGAQIDSTGGPLLYTTFTRELAPVRVDVPDLEGVERVSIRVQGHRFRVRTSRPLSVNEGGSDHLVIQPAAAPMEIVLEVPPYTRRLTVRLGGQTALQMDGTAISTLCTPVTRQRLSNDRLWFTFNPRGGTLQCGTAQIQRHGG